jgi:hypothetical protein
MASLSIDHELIWFPTGAPVLDKEGYRIQSPKLILTVVWNSYGFYLVDFLSKRMKFNGSYYRPVRKYMPQPHPLGSGVRLSSYHISRVCTI